MQCFSYCMISWPNSFYFSVLFSICMPRLNKWKTSLPPHPYRKTNGFPPIGHGQTRSKSRLPPRDEHTRNWLGWATQVQGISTLLGTQAASHSWISPREWPALTLTCRGHCNTFLYKWHIGESDFLNGYMNLTLMSGDLRLLPNLAFVMAVPLNSIAVSKTTFQ